MAKPNEQPNNFTQIDEERKEKSVRPHIWHTLQGKIDIIALLGFLNQRFEATKWKIN